MQDVAVPAGDDHQRDHAVVHSHSPAVIPFGVTKSPLRPLYHMSAFLAPGVPVFEIRTAAGGMTNMLINNSKLGKDLAATLGDKNVALMRGHGNVVVASTLPMAVFRAYYTEINARLQLQATAIGSEITFLDKEEGVSFGAEILVAASAVCGDLGPLRLDFASSLMVAAAALASAVNLSNLTTKSDFFCHTAGSALVSPPV
jgi:hypothetical protein